MKGHRGCLLRCSCQNEDYREPFPIRTLHGDTSSGPFGSFLHLLRGFSRQMAQMRLTGGDKRTVYYSPDFLLVEILWQTQLEFVTPG